MDWQWPRNIGENIRLTIYLLAFVCTAPPFDLAVDASLPCFCRDVPPFLFQSRTYTPLMVPWKTSLAPGLVEATSLFNRPYWKHGSTILPAEDATPLHGSEEDTTLPPKLRRFRSHALKGVYVTSYWDCSLPDHQGVGR